jgi:hypothetical protein
MLAKILIAELFVRSRTAGRQLPTFYGSETMTMTLMEKLNTVLVDPRQKIST